MAIINSISEVKVVFGAPNVNNEFDSLAPYINDATELLLRFTGMDLYDLIEGMYDDQANDAKKKRILSLSQKVLVNQAYYMLSFDGTMVLDDTGFKRVKTEYAESAYQWQIRDFRSVRNSIVWQSLNELVKLLNSNITTAYGVAWKASPEYADLKKYFAWNYNLFNEQRSCKSFEVVDKLRPSMLHVQQSIIENNLGAELYDALLISNASNNFSSDQAKLLPMVIDAVANLSTARAIDEEIVIFGKDGVEINEFKGQSADGSQATKNQSQLAVIKKAAEEKGLTAVKRLRSFLNKNASANKYESYFNSDLYDDPNDTTEKSVHLNDPNSPTFGAF